MGPARSVSPRLRIPHAGVVRCQCSPDMRTAAEHKRASRAVPWVSCMVHWRRAGDFLVWSVEAGRAASIILDIQVGVKATCKREPSVGVRVGPRLPHLRERPPHLRETPQMRSESESLPAFKFGRFQGGTIASRLHMGYRGSHLQFSVVPGEGSLWDH
jgi:hypothetical protein